MKEKDLVHLSRRKRQIMDALFELGEAGAAEIRRMLPDPPSYSTVRTQLRVLEEKGFLSHTEQGPRFVYSPTIPARRAGMSALRRLKRTFFDNSVESVIAALLELPDSELSQADLDRLTRLVERARREGK